MTLPTTSQLSWEPILTPPPPRQVGRPNSKLGEDIKALQPNTGLVILCNSTDPKEYARVGQLVWGASSNSRKNGRKYVIRKLSKGVGLWRVS